MRARIAISAGSPEPLGVTPVDVGVNVAIVSRHATHMEFCVFDERGEREVARLPLGRVSDTVFCGFVTGIGPGTRYGFRADGDYEPALGHWFDPAKLLVDPYARQIDRPFVLVPELSANRAAAIDTAPFVPKGIVTGEDGAPAPRPRGHRGRPPFIYELPVRAYTRQRPDVPRKLRGTLAGLATPSVIEGLVRLGVDTVELMPIAAWIDDRHLPGLGLTNAWGYNPVVFMAPDPRLAPGGLAEVRQAVGALHEAGLDVILDAVFNHTGEGDELGPTLSLRGLDSALYYRRGVGHGLPLDNDAGTGNTLAVATEPVVRLVLDAMRHWVAATGIDGFRLDLATVLGRTETGFRVDAPILSAIAEDPVLGQCAIVAEPWDVGPGGYQLGNFPNAWSEWNDRYRDDIRRFWRGDADTLGTLATRLAGSADIFGARRPSASINFIAAHDGFTLADLVAYEAKRNVANGEHNRDGANANFSWNSGVEGRSADPAIVAARSRDVRALIATLFVSRGSLMLTAGDEFGRTQGGNNNGYALDSHLTWLDWKSADAGRTAFVAALAAFRRAHPSVSADAFLTGAPLDASGIPDALWLHPSGRAMTGVDWSAEARVLGLARYTAADDTNAADRTLVWLNGDGEAVDAWLPPARTGFAWRLAVNSSASPAGEEKVAPAGPIVLPPRSVLVFAEASKS